MNREMLMLVDAISREKTVERDLVFGAGGYDLPTVAMHEAGGDRVVVLAERIVALAGEADILVAGHDVGAAQRLARVVQTHQAGVIGCDADRERPLML